MGENFRYVLAIMSKLERSSGEYEAVCSQVLSASDEWDRGETVQTSQHRTQKHRLVKHNTC